MAESQPGKKTDQSESDVPKKSAILHLGWTSFCMISFIVLVLVYARVEARRLPKPTVVYHGAGVPELVRGDDQFQLALKALEVGDLDGVNAQLIALRQSGGKESRIRFLEGALLIKRNQL